METRLEFHERLKALINSNCVYFQPPESVKLSYPCIIYHLSGSKRLRADNELYSGRKRYDLMLITKDPDTPLFDKISALPYCAFDRFYTSNNLNHFSFTIYL